MHELIPETSENYCAEIHRSSRVLGVGGTKRGVGKWGCHRVVRCHQHVEVAGWICFCSWCSTSLFQPSLELSVRLLHFLPLSPVQHQLFMCVCGGGGGGWSVCVSVGVCR